MDNKGQRISYLLDQYAKNNITHDEEQEMWTILDTPTYEEEVKNVLFEKFRAEKSLAAPVPIKWAPVWEKVLQKTREDQTGGQAIKPLPKGYRSHSWIRIAAAAVIFLLVGTGVWYYMQVEQKKELALSGDTSLKEDVAPPRTSQATLTLSNGKTIILDIAGIGMLAQQGDVNVMKMSDGQIMYVPLSEDSEGEISYNTLSNPRGSKAINISLADGSKVWLNAESSLRYPTAFVGGQRRVEITGEAYFEVAHNAESPFLVAADGVEVEVLGTHFNIKGYMDEPLLRTTLLSGSVKIIQGDKSLILQPGEQAQAFRTANRNIQISRPDLSDVMAWKDGRFAFSDMDLPSIMREMARWYNMEVVFQDAVPDHYTVNISRDVNVSQVFKFIEMSGGVRFDIRNKVITVKK